MKIIKYGCLFVGIFLLSLGMSVFVETILSRSVLCGYQFEIADMTNCIITALATSLVLYELNENDKTSKHQSDITEAAFVLQYNQTFIQDQNMTDVERLLERQGVYRESIEIITEENKQKFINYLVYLEGLSLLVLNNVLTLDCIDDLMAYRFFLAMNNLELQKKELCAFPEYYRGCFKLYKKWKHYRESMLLKILLEENSIDKWKEFKKYAT